MSSIRDLTRAYCQRSDALASASYFGTFAVYFLTLYLAIHHFGTWYIAVPLVVVNALAGVRLYVLQHDCGHRSLFTKRWMNDWAGYALSTFTLTPYRAMQFNHNQHHKFLGDLDERRAGEIHTMTLREWQEADWKTRLFYRLYRNPFILIPLGGLFVYVIRYRWPKNTMQVGPAGVLVHDALLLAWVALLWWLGGVPALVVYGATVIIAACTGVFLVYLQHNFEDTYWDHRPDLRHDLAALQGSSALDLGWWFDLATGNIAYHDIHHFNANIPSYRLRECHRELREIFDLPTINWPEAIRSFTLKLWDEDQGKLVPFPKREGQHGRGPFARGAQPG
ncbi:fatty acid desaturase [Rhodobacteraceae bacterium W635]|uniref:fatty acid desaturase n=1 Tax=Nioella halotolerans TaxID=2303578 RepID=UPI000E3C9354|nr:fatty acid desaturase [Rhodobacteraceae bacterium W635]